MKVSAHRITNQRWSLTIREPAIGVVRGALALSILIKSVNLDVVSACLMPVKHLLGALDTFALVIFAPNGGLGSGDGLGARAASDSASEGLVVHVGLATSRGHVNIAANNRLRKAYPLGIYRFRGRKRKESVLQGHANSGLENIPSPTAREKRD